MWTISVKLLSQSLLPPCFFLAAVCAYCVSWGEPWPQCCSQAMGPNCALARRTVLHYLVGVYRQDGARRSLWVQSGRTRGSGHMPQLGRLWPDMRKKSSPLPRWLSGGTGWSRSLGNLHPWRSSELGCHCAEWPNLLVAGLGCGDTWPCLPTPVVLGSSDPVSYLSHRSAVSSTCSL